MSCKELIAKASATHYLTRDELILLLKDKSCSNLLFAAADDIRHRYVGDEIHLRGLIEFSNICRNNCCYCGLRRDNHNLTRYRLSQDEIFALAKQINRNLGVYYESLDSEIETYITPWLNMGFEAKALEESSRSILASSPSRGVSAAANRSPRPTK